MSGAIPPGAPPRLAELQQQMHDAVKDRAPVAVVAAALGVDPKRLAIYRRMIRHHVVVALCSRLGATTALLGADQETPAWTALLEGYLEACPPSHWALGHAAGAFPGYLAERVGAQGVTPFHVAVAELEWALYTVNRDETRLPPRHPAYVEGAPLALNPTLQILEWPYPVAAFLAAFNRGEGPAVPTAPTDPELVLVFRRPVSGNPYFQAATPALLFALKVVHDGLSVDEAVVASGQQPADVEAALRHATDIGLVLALA
ncbi:MAG: DNA-binding domain-containing protein [bacterium]